MVQFHELTFGKFGVAAVHLLSNGERKYRITQEL
jgi:hypothetical protein